MPIVFDWKIILTTYNKYINLYLKYGSHKYVLHEKHALNGEVFVESSYFVPYQKK